jgi:FtsP/CotA-like multicopper oxidase with cupredoxin domain
MEHPFHLHGFFFQVVSRNGVPEAEATWEDTIQLRGQERVRIAFRPTAAPATGCTTATSSSTSTTA